MYVCSEWKCVPYVFDFDWFIAQTKHPGIKE